MKYTALLLTLLISSPAIAEVTPENTAKAKIRYSIKLDLQHLMRTTTHCMAITALDSKNTEKHDFANAYYKQCMKRFGDITV